jgi:hypothetical protein
LVETKLCNICGEEKPISEYFVNRSSQGGRSRYCKLCLSIRQKKNRSKEEYKLRRKAYESSPEGRVKAIARKKAMFARRPELIRNGNLKRRFGLSHLEYDEMFRAQDGLCAICKLPETFIGKGGDVIRLAVDHDHETGKVRALLCRSCNIKLGVIENDMNFVALAIEYRNYHRSAEVLRPGLSR